MTNELIKKRLMISLGKEVLIFLHNGFRYQGIITGCDEHYLEIVQPKPKGYKIIELSQIAQAEVKE